MGLDPQLRGLGLDEVEEAVISYVCFEIFVRGLTPQSVCGSYLAGIKNSFILSGARNKFKEALGLDTVRLTIKGATKIYHRAHPKSGTKKLAFTLELVKYCGAALGPVSGSKVEQFWGQLKRDAVTIGMELGIWFLLRRSEFLPHRGVRGEWNRGLQWSGLRFLSSEGHRLGWEVISLDLVYMITISIQFSKTDQLGEGRVRTHVRQEHGHCIVRTIVDWALSARRRGDTVNSFVFEGFGFTLATDTSVAMTMKMIVEHVGLDNRLISTHSLRYGGATMLAAAGAPAYVIAYFGGWTEDSEMLRTYAQLGGQAVERVSQIMSYSYDRPLAEARIRENTLGVHKGLDVEGITERRYDEGGVLPRMLN
jgi:hypothetical protein